VNVFATTPGCRRQGLLPESAGCGGGGGVGDDVPADRAEDAEDARHPLTGDPVKAVEVLANRYTLNDTERAGVLRHLIVEGDLSAYGLVNAVTHYSQEVTDYDRATDFEALGGKLIELPVSDWREVVQAA
jgi:hypothetical protein